MKADVVVPPVIVAVGVEANVAVTFISSIPIPCELDPVVIRFHLRYIDELLVIVKPVILMPVLEIIPQFVPEGVPEGLKLYELVPVVKPLDISPLVTAVQVEPSVE